MSKSEPISSRALNRATLGRQMLLGRERRGIVETLTHLLGMQGQVGNAPYIGLWSRLEGFEREALTTLIKDRRLVRATAMRATIHMMTAEDFLALFPLTLGVVRRMLSGSWGKHYVGVDVEAIAEAGRALIEAEPLTSAEIGERLKGRWPDREASALGIAVRSLLPVVHVPPAGLWNRGKAPQLTTARTWLGREPGAAMDLTVLVKRYLAAFGPASVMDMQNWCGLTRLGPVFENLRDELVTFEGEDGRELFDVPEATRPGEDVEAPVRLLPDYDNVVLGLADRQRFVEVEDTKGLAVGNAYVPAFLVDGRVAGLWNFSSRGKAAAVTIKAFRQLGPEAVRELEAEGQRLAADMAPELPAEVRVGVV
jgi:uncharacterized protein YcaQ